MAQVNITHITTYKSDKNADFAHTVHAVVAREVYGIKDSVSPNAVTVLTTNMHPEASISGADSELQVLISGNDWPKHADETPYDYAQAKIYFDDLARRIHTGISEAMPRNLYVWVTPFVASGWAE